MLEVRWLSTDTISHVADLLHSHSLLEPGESVVSLEPAGEGNMNVTLRVTLAASRTSNANRTLIVKQSRPFVAKFDTLAAPLERVEYEAAFYEFARQHQQLACCMPHLLGWIPDEFVLVLEDLGTASDATYLYAQAPQSCVPDYLSDLLDWLHCLHKTSRDRLDFERFRNRRLRELNHAHIFDIPFQHPPAADLDRVCGGLAEATRAIRQHEVLRTRALELGRLYLSDSDCLLHGDYYPGSWLITESGPKIIDPEFCFAGRAEFDLGIMLAHLELMACPHAEDHVATSVSVHQPQLDFALIRRFAAIELLRRLLGVAQLPLVSSLHQRLSLIEHAAATLLS